MELQIFKNEQFGEVRMVVIEEQPLFLGNDVANILGYKRPGDAIKQHIDEEDRKTLTYKAFGDLEPSLWQGNDFSNKTFITESGVYALIFGSELPQAKQFKRWVTSEVLPSIRKNGAYVTNQKAVEIMSNPNALGEFLQGIANQVKQLELQNSNLVEKNEVLEVELLEARKQARYLDVIIESKGAVRVTQIAADYGMSANRFNKLLHELGVQHKVNGQWILYKKYMGKGYTDSTTFDYLDKNGQARANMTTTWTQKGRLFLYELLKNNDILPLIEQDEVA
ncbi:TPA: phage antirepressor KilAC domain-containing protein [Streptococcus suis 14A]|uniref:phage antirepressor n=1 Tax=Streptococcus suis TaxID=1307 RepID=UPI00040C4176|nr:phage antirepressor KilAC domain-containing protein [Streptococcus suis]MCK3974245.1 phage antirepressor [Streptococcus suis]HEM3199327.1 phage antirepressor KilAC domain-containing protein [Streptococcus suis 14A]